MDIVEAKLPIRQGAPGLINCVRAMAAIDSASTCAEYLRQQLESQGLLNDSGDDGSLEIHLTDLSEEFEALASRFLTKAPGSIRRAQLDA